MGADLDFGTGSWQEARGTVFTTLRQLSHDIYGNGQPGLAAKVTEMELANETRWARIEAYAKAAEKWGRITVAVVTLFFGAMATYIAFAELRRHETQTHAIPLTENGRYFTAETRGIYVDQ